MDRRKASSPIASAAALLLLATGCAGPTRTGAGTPQSTANSLVSDGVGWVTVRAPANNPDAPALRVQGATLYPHTPGTEELRMTITDDSAVPDHLYAITSPTATADLFTAASTPRGTPQPAPATGIDLEPGTTVQFGPGGPRILLRSPTGTPFARPFTLELVFAVAGQVPLTVPATTPFSSSGPATGSTATGAPSPGTTGTR